MYRTLSAPLNVQVELTQRCNEVCRHCYNYFRHESDPWYTLSFSDIDRIVGEFSENQVLRGVITGGEPLVSFDHTLHLARQMRQANMRVTLNSNMALFTKDVGEELLKMGINTILTSLIADEPKLHDWVTQSSGAWQKIADNIQLALKMGFRVLVNMVLTKWNIDRVQQTGDLVGSWGVQKFGATRACAPGPIACGFVKNLISVEELRKSLDIMDGLQKKWGYAIDVFEHYPWCAISDLAKFSYIARRKCTAGITSATIGADGQLRPCGHSARTYGSVIEEGLVKPWLKMTDWRQQIYSKECSDCKFFRMCTGGCPVEAENSEDGKDHHCTKEGDVMSLPKKVEYESIDSNTSFVIPSYVVLREESFGGIIASGIGGNLLVDEDTFAILKKLKINGSFSAKSVSTEYQINLTETVETLSRLKYQQLIK